MFSPGGGNQVAETPEVIFDLTQGYEGMKTPHPNDSLKASLSPPVGLLCSFRRDWQTTNAQTTCKTLLPIVTVYHSSPIQISQSSPDLLRIQGPSV